MEIQKSQKSQKNKIIYECIICHYITGNKNDYNKHLSTAKHIKNENNRAMEMNGNNEIARLLCVHCNKLFLSNSGLWKHRKKCAILHLNNTDTDILETPCQNIEGLNETFYNKEREPEPLQNTFTPINNDNSYNSITPEMFMEVFKQNKELQNVIIEQNNKLLELANKQGSNTNINSHNTNNNQFNLQFFLNETCKDAMNIVDFINSLKLTTDDFETTGKLGFIDGISRIIIKELKKLETEKLPIHCTDLKRETVYIKDNNIWEKENDDKKRINWAIDKVAQLNLNQLQNWQEEFPECKENNTPENQRFFKLASVALGGRGKDEEDKFREKIMKNVIKEVVLDKKCGKQ